jgi:hypothetical protein
MKIEIYQVERTIVQKTKDFFNQFRKFFRFLK